LRSCLCYRKNGINQSGTVYLYRIFLSHSDLLVFLILYRENQFIMTEITFNQREKNWVGETDALGKSVLQVQRKAKGSLFIYQFIPGMEPVQYKSMADAEANVVVALEIIKGMKVQVVSSTEVVKCKMIGVNFTISPEGALMEDDIVNDLTTGGADKPLSAEQGKVLNGKIPTNALKTTDLVDDLTTGGTNKALTAEQGKALKNLIPTDVLKTTSIVNDLTTGGTGKPLSAEQGKGLKALIDALTLRVDALESV